MRDTHCREMVAILGATRNTDNYGVRFLLTSAVETLSRARPGVDVVSVDYGREAAVSQEWTPLGEIRVPLINLRFSWRIYLANNIFRLLAWVIISRVLLPQQLREKWWKRNNWLRKILLIS